MPSRANAGKAATGARGATGAKGAKSSTKSAAIPSAHRSAPKFEERNIPRYDDPQFKGKLADINSLAVDIINLNKRKAELEDLIKEKSVMIQAEMMDINEQESWSVKDDSWTVSFIKPSPQRKLVVEKLISQGVPLAKIEKAYDLIPKKPYVQVRGRSEQSSSYEED